MTPAPKHLRRRIPLSARKAVKRYINRTGKVLWAWNKLHADLFIIFWFSLGKSKELARDLWHATRSDETQRDMMLAAASHSLADRPKVFERIKWINTKIEKFAKYRNLAAHTPVEIRLLGLLAVPPKEVSPKEAATKKQWAEQFSRIDHKRFWSILTGDLIALSEYAYYISREVVTPRGPLPRKPPLLSLPMIREIDAQLDRLRQTAMQPPQKPALHRKRGKSARAPGSEAEAIARLLVHAARPVWMYPPVQPGSTIVTGLLPDWTASTPRRSEDK